MKTAFSTYLPACLLLLLSLAACAESLPPGMMRIDNLPAPALQLDNLDGEAYDLAKTHGHWRFVHFWASWCGPCRREMPGIERMISALGDSELEIVLINTAETEDEVFITHEAATAGVDVENTGSEPLVSLRYFGPDVHTQVPSVGDYK